VPRPDFVTSKLVGALPGTVACWTAKATIDYTPM
jgi:hypothetical protein